VESVEEEIEGERELSEGNEWWGGGGGEDKT
jgi:hypothetical protein